MTFNYDTLLEQAINSVRPTVTRNALSHGIYADEVVFPAPPAPASQYMMDGAGQADDSFQVLKLHGSLNWYWAAGDSTGSTLVRLREKRVLGGAPLTVDVDFAGASTLDRYLIPPVTSKDSYYNSYLSHTLWRSARNAIEAAPRVTLMGYSMPSNDRVAVELVRQANTDLTVVDLAPGSIDEPLSLVHRLSRIGRVGGVFAGESALIEFTSNQLENALTGLRDKLGAEMPERDADAVVLATSGGEGQVDFHCLWIDMSGLVRTYNIDPSLARGSDMPLHAIARNQIPASQGSEIREFLSRGSLRSWLSQNRNLKIQSPIGEVLAIDASDMVMERWRMVRLSAVSCE